MDVKLSPLLLAPIWLPLHEDGKMPCLVDLVRAKLIRSDRLCEDQLCAAQIKSVHLHHQRRRHQWIITISDIRGIKDSIPKDYLLPRRHVQPVPARPRGETHARHLSFMSPRFL